MKEDVKGFFHRVLFKAVDYLRLHQNTYIIMIAIVIGILGGIGAIGFRILIDFIQGLTVGQGEVIIDSLKQMPWFYKLFLPSLGGLIVGPLIYFFAREAKGHGVPEVMEAIALRGGRIRPRVVAVKALASAITLGTGGSVGREGPIVQIGSAMGSSIGQILHLSQERVKILVACGAAAGIAATFNAPITGVLFAVEIILGNFAIHTFSPLVVSSVLATVISRAYYNDIPTFTVPTYSLINPAVELPLYLILGFVIAGIGLVFMNSIHFMEDFFRTKVKLPEYLQPAVGLLGIGIIICFVPHIFGNGYETITLSMSDKIGLGLLAALIPIKILATSLTLGAGGSGGILAPSLFLGAVTGGTFGTICHFFLPDATASSGAYAMVGMGAMVGAVTHAPVTAIITLFELTGDYKIILPLMFSCIFATLIASSLKKDSIYTGKLSQRGVKLNVGLESAIMTRNIVGEIMHVDVKTIDPEMSFEKLFNHILNGKDDAYYVVGLDGMYMGEICVHDLSKTLNVDGIHSKRTAIDIMNPSYPKVGPDETLMQCIRMFGIYGVQELPVIDTHTNQFIGVINHRDIFVLYNREVLREGTLGLKFVTKGQDTDRSDYVNIPEDYSVELLPVTGNLVGRSIRDLDLRGRFGITIVAIKSQDDRDRKSEMPVPERILTRQDGLVVVGKKEDIQRVRRLV